MQNSKSGTFKEIFITLVLGAVIGFSVAAFIKCLNQIELFHIQSNAGQAYHLILIPLVLVLLEMIKRNTLYFPTKTVHLTDKESSHYWSVFMSPIYFAGTLLSHVSGVSVGRESAAVLFSAGFVRIFRSSWVYWGPIAGSVGFAAVVGQYWVAPFFMMELFGKTSLFQKIYSFMGAMLAVLIVRSVDIHQFFSYTEINFDIGFFKKLFFLFIFAGIAGYIMRLYKKLYFLFSNYFLTQSLKFKAAICVLLALFLYLPEFRMYQSLGLLQISDSTFTNGSFVVAVTKLFFTLLSTTIGFFGGEFIPLVFAGVHLGFSVFNYFGFSPLLGAALGAYILFAGATRFKWSAYILILCLMGLSWWFWAYYVVSIAIGFSGEKSLYKKEYLTF